MAQTIAPPSSREPVTGTATAVRKRRPFLLDLYSTAVGKKYVMAVTGVLMIGFVVAHMVGNTKMYWGADDLDGYAAFLKRILYPLAPKESVLWVFRAVLLGSVALHIHAAWSLTQLNRRARPVKYQSARDYQVANFASRTMRWTGIVVLLFIVWHLLDLTFGVTNTIGTSGEFVREDVYANVVRSFERVPVAIFYILANIALGVHLFHGTWSLFQSMGWSNPRFNRWRRAIAIGVATIVVVGNVSFPVAVLAGVVG